MIKANNPKLSSWVDVPKDSDFPIQNLPFGIFRTPGLSPRLCTAIGDQVADLQVLAEHGFFDDLNLPRSVFARPNLNEFMALGRKKTRMVRDRLSEILDNDLEEWDASQLAEYFLHPQSRVNMMLPVKIGDYTDFYSSLEHATNVGSLFRDPENALMPNWRHLPAGYHGRASSIVISGTPIKRPRGQQSPTHEGYPVFGPSRQLDFELEVAFVLGKSTQLGASITTEEAEDYIFGLILFNDWSARDIQRWEYQPLGPFLSKSFASTVSPWIVTLDALEPFRCAGPEQDPVPLPYLQCKGENNFDINLEVLLQTDGDTPRRITRTNYKNLYWNMRQQLAHQTVNGCNVNIGDLYASGTISGPTPDSYGSLLELTAGGTRPIGLPDGNERRFLEDGDSIVLQGWCERNGLRIGFGKAEGKIIGE